MQHWGVGEREGVQGVFHASDKFLEQGTGADRGVAEPGLWALTSRL